MMPQYYIEAGVRRCVVAREAGKADIAAVVHEPGQPPYVTRIPLSQLHSPKPFILRDHRYISDTEYPTLVLKTEPPPIAVQPLGLPRQGRTTPLLLVSLQ
jgi:hypothetical protein